MKNIERFIVLRKIKFSEADLVIHGISQRGEKMAFMARSALKSKRRFGGGVLELINFVEFDYSISKTNQGLHVLNEASLIRDFATLKKDYDKIEFALEVLETISKVIQEGDEESQKLFQIVGHLFSHLDQQDQAAFVWKNLKMQFYLKFLMQQGVLAQEPWMAPFLKTKFEDYRQIPRNEHFDEWLQAVHYQLKMYVETASTL
ncbi:MAG: DNA repair protein RecO [Pseudobdellovibrionaceae bacterium]|jgi:DNA repair protein RecO (recombination protein O)